MDKLLIICGPTASGKTAFAVSVAKRCNGELISADSRQIYKGMDVGTGKDLPKKRVPIRTVSHSIGAKPYVIPSFGINGIPLWMCDVVRPDDEFSVSHFVLLATEIIRDIRSRGKLPVIVGGTGFYIDALLHPPETIHIPVNKELRARLQPLSVGDLQQMLKDRWPEELDRMNNSDRNNPRRLVRRIEVLSGVPPVQKYPDTLSGDVLQIGLTMQLQLLFQRIDDRVDKRVREGIVDEIKRLLDHGYGWNLPSMSGLGYSEWKSYIDSESVRAYDDAVKKWKTDEHVYAKHQMTWFRTKKDISWFDASHEEERNRMTERIVTWYTQNRDEHKD